MSTSQVQILTGNIATFTIVPQASGIWDRTRVARMIIGSKGGQYQAETSHNGGESWQPCLSLSEFLMSLVPQGLSTHPISLKVMPGEYYQVMWGKVILARIITEIERYSCWVECPTPEKGSFARMHGPLRFKNPNLDEATIRAFVASSWSANWLLKPPEMAALKHWMAQS